MKEVVFNQFKIDEESYPLGFQKMKDYTAKIREISIESVQDSDLIDNYIVNSNSILSLQEEIESKINLMQKLKDKIEDISAEAENFLSFYTGYESLKDDFLNEAKAAKMFNEDINIEDFKQEIEKEFNILFDDCKELKSDTLIDFEAFKTQINCELLEENLNNKKEKVNKLRLK